MRYEIYWDDYYGFWSWRYIAANNVVMAISGYTYKRKRDAKRAARRTRYLMILDGPFVEVNDET